MEEIKIIEPPYTKPESKTRPLEPINGNIHQITDEISDKHVTAETDKFIKDTILTNNKKIPKNRYIVKIRGTDTTPLVINDIVKPNIKKYNRDIKKNQNS